MRDVKKSTMRPKPTKTKPTRYIEPTFWHAAGTLPIDPPELLHTLLRVCSVAMSQPPTPRSPRPRMNTTTLLTS
jgi:hypothetical protein